MIRNWTASELWKVARVGEPVPAPDGQFLLVGVTRHDVDRNEGREQLHMVPTGSGPPREARVLTAAATSSSAADLSPDGRRVAFVRKPGATEHEQLFVLPLDGGEARQVTELPLGASCPRWMPDGKRVVLLAPLLSDGLTVEDTARLRDERAGRAAPPRVTEARVVRFWDRWLTGGEVVHVFLVDVDSGEARDLTPGSRRWFDLMDPSGQLDVSPDGEEIVFSASLADPPVGLVRFALHAVSVASGSLRCLTPDNPADDLRPRYNPDGRSILFGAKRELDNYADRVRLVRLDRQTLQQQVLTESWDRSAVSWEHVDARSAVVEAEERGRSCLFRLDLGGEGAPVLLTDDGSWHAPRPARDGYVYAQRSTIATPPEPARVPLAGGATERLAAFNRELLSELRPGRLEEIELRGAGGEPVQMWLLHPPDDRPGPRPLLQVLHGGPYGAHHDGWHFRWNAQVFAAFGYVTALVNFHGSSGFGQRFSDSILGDWGGRAAEDVLLATDLLIERGIADPRRMAIMGGSFGGYMAAWLATQTDRFACAVAHAAVYSLASTLACDVTQGTEREFGGEPWNLPRDRDAVHRWDPAAWTGNHRTPTLVIHGEKDYRVPVEQGLALYGMLKAKGVAARLVVYPEENHWILKPQSSLHWYGEVKAWLDRYLQPS